MSDPGAGAELIRLSVGRLPLVLDARGSGIRMALPRCHTKFVTGTEPSASGELTLSVRDRPLRRTEGWRAVYAPEHGWQLWQDEAERYVFVASPRLPPQRQITIDTRFQDGEVIGHLDGHARTGQIRYPLDGIEIMLFANWLANSGDLILHAAGLDCAGRGYCFAGTSGAGKSTLAAAVARAPDCTVLGEDNVILRWLDGRFWIFGTPWHLNPAMCSPRGVPLDRLFFLDRSGEPGIRPCAQADGITRLLQSAFVPYYRPEAVSEILDHLTLLALRVPFYCLHYHLGGDVSTLIRAT